MLAASCKAHFRNHPHTYIVYNNFEYSYKAYHSLFIKKLLLQGKLISSIFEFSRENVLLWRKLWLRSWLQVRWMRRLQNVPRLELLRRDHHHRDSRPRRCSVDELSVRGFRRDFRCRERCLQVRWMRRLQNVPRKKTQKTLHEMDATIGKVFDSVSTFFSGVTTGSSDEFPLCDTDIISGCEKELAEAQKGQDEGFKKESIMRLSWALVHSKGPADIQRGIAMLEGSVVSDTSPMTLREKLYLLAIGYYRSGDFSRSRDYIERCLEVEPEWRQAQTLRTAIEDRIVKDGVIGVGIAVTAVGVVAGIAAALLRRG